MEFKRTIPIETCRKLATATERAEGDTIIAIRYGAETLYITGDWREGDRIEFLVKTSSGRGAEVTKTIPVEPGMEK